MWSEETKRGLLHHHPNLMLIDAFSSSEALGMGTSVSSGNAAEHTARFTLSPDVRVLDPESNKDVTPGSGEVGVLALGGRNPVGYYKDPDKSASHLQGDRRRSATRSPATSPRWTPTAPSTSSAGARW